MINHYELLYIIPGTKAEDEVQPLAEQIRAVVSQHGGTITKSDFWGKRKLAYEIDHIRQGYYDLVEFDLESTKLAALESAFRLRDEVLRHQIVRKELKSPEQLAAEQALRDRIAAKRQAAKEKEQVASLTPAPVEKAPVATGPVETKELEKKLEELLESDKLDV